MKFEKANLSEKFDKLPAGDYAVGLIAKMNDYDIKIVKFKGDFVWHSHPGTDETFIIIEGTLVMNSRDRKLEVHAGEMIVIPSRRALRISHLRRADTKPSSLSRREYPIPVMSRAKSPSQRLTGYD